MVDKSTTSPLLPGWAYCAATVAGVPLLACAAFLGLNSSAPLFVEHLGVFGWIALGVALIALAAPALGLLPRLRRMPAAWRATWALIGATLGALLTAPWGFVLFIALLYLSCRGQDCVS